MKPLSYVESLPCTTASEFLNTLSPRDRTFSGTWIFRGHGDANWQLFPCAFRAMARDPFDPCDPIASAEATRWSREQYLLWNFGEGLDQQGLPLPGGHERLQKLIEPDNSPQWVRDHAELVALAQHHGVPTRLLDFTWKAFAAAYFAALQPKVEAEHLAVWALNPEFLSYGDRTTGVWYSLIRASRASNPNMHAQSGAFVTWTGLEEALPLDELVRRVSSRDIELCPGTTFQLEPPLLVKVTLPRSQASELLRLLGLEGVHGASMFPGCDGVVRRMREQPTPLDLNKTTGDRT